MYSLFLVLAKSVARHQGHFCQGGLDDYFLSGSTTCSDGAESCPDTTKVDKSQPCSGCNRLAFQGGEKNVEMLNSVSRDNYTMLTFRYWIAPEQIWYVPGFYITLQEATGSGGPVWYLHSHLTPAGAETFFYLNAQTSQIQEVFWSVGYKLAEKRMQTKPLKNQG